MTKTIYVLCTIFMGAFAELDPEFTVLIVGGLEAPDGAFPYQISIKTQEGKHRCGGSIINPTTILTAAHCVQGFKPESLSVVAGTNRLDTGETPYAIKTIKIHENYTVTVKNDIALLKLTTPITYTDKIGPVALETSSVREGTRATLSGWGWTSYPGHVPNQLQYINLTTISVPECQLRHLEISFPIDDFQVCTLTQQTEGACKGDSGGPLVADGRQIGIVSWGTPCAVGKPDVFTSVSSYIDWIKKNSEL